MTKEIKENKSQRWREKLFTIGENFRDKIFKEFGYTYNHSWILFDEDELSDLIDEREMIEEQEIKEIVAYLDEQIETAIQEIERRGDGDLQANMIRDQRIQSKISTLTQVREHIKKEYGV